MCLQQKSSHQTSMHTGQSEIFCKNIRVCDPSGAIAECPSPKYATVIDLLFCTAALHVVVITHVLVRTFVVATPSSVNNGSEKHGSEPAASSAAALI